MQSANPDTICIWRGRTLFLGSLPQSQLHRHSAAAACVGLDGPFRVQEQGVWRECLSALIPQNVEHNLDSDGPCAVLFMDPESTGYSRLSESNACNDSCVINFKEAEDLRSVFSSVFRGDVSAALLEEIDRITFRS
ncbi:MAG: hypothetical protein JNM27_19055, partial [Leptospirales bacterium]|nr:hypothetical protein [Leptospirales bacterium]